MILLYVSFDLNGRHYNTNIEVNCLPEQIALGQDSTVLKEYAELAVSGFMDAKGLTGTPQNIIYFI